jgi:pimeloyl-ACP methyl ester carboxylesterase
VALHDIDVHFLHVPGKGPNPCPLLLMHGWPGSVFEFLELIPRLTDPASFGGAASDAFTVVAPSLPGYGLSFRPDQRRFGVEDIAHCFADLMTNARLFPLRGAGRRLLAGTTEVVGGKLRVPQRQTGHQDGAAYCRRCTRAILTGCLACAWWLPSAWLRPAARRSLPGSSAMIVGTLSDADSRGCGVGTATSAGSVVATSAGAVVLTAASRFGVRHL